MADKLISELSYINTEGKPNLLFEVANPDNMVLMAGHGSVPRSEQVSVSTIYTAAQQYGTSFTTIFVSAEFEADIVGKCYQDIIDAHAYITSTTTPKQIWDVMLIGDFPTIPAMSWVRYHGLYNARIYNLSSNNTEDLNCSVDNCTIHGFSSGNLVKVINCKVDTTVIVQVNSSTEFTVGEILNVGTVAGLFSIPGGIACIALSDVTTEIALGSNITNGLSSRVMQGYISEQKTNMAAMTVSGVSILDSNIVSLDLTQLTTKITSCNNVFFCIFGAALSDTGSSFRNGIIQLYGNGSPEFTNSSVQADRLGPFSGAARFTASTLDVARIDSETADIDIRGTTVTATFLRADNSTISINAYLPNVWAEAVVGTGSIAVHNWGAGLPSGATEGDILTWNSSTNLWELVPAPVPDDTDHLFLRWDIVTHRPIWQLIFQSDVMPGFSILSFSLTPVLVEIGSTLNSIDFFWTVSRPGDTAVGTLTDPESNLLYTEDPMLSHLSGDPHTENAMDLQYDETQNYLAGNMAAETLRYSYRRFTLAFTDVGGTSGNRTADTYWGWKTFWGKSPSAPTVLQAFTTSSQFELELNSVELKTNVSGNYNFTAPGAAYLYICVPASFTIPLFVLAPFEITFEEYATTNPVVNSEGASITYKIYKSEYLQNGTDITITATQGI